MRLPVIDRLIVWMDSKSARVKHPRRVFLICAFMSCFWALASGIISVAWVAIFRFALLEVHGSIALTGLAVLWFLSVLWVRKTQRVKAEWYEARF
jgi:hypothetical protein